MSKPTPLSRTWNVAQPPSTRPSTSTLACVPRGAVYLIALEIRLIQTWRSSAGSPGTCGSEATDTVACDGASSRATSRLRKAGYSVGLMGARDY